VVAVAKAADGIRLSGGLPVPRELAAAERGRRYARREEARSARRRRAILASMVLVGGLFVAGVADWEERTSFIQSHLFSWLASDMTYEIMPGPSPFIAFPSDGPLDRRRGYTRIGEFQRRLVERGYEVRQQARLSPGLAAHVARGLDPPEWLPARAGLLVLGSDGKVLHAPIDRAFRHPAAVPALVRDALLLIEDRELMRLDGPTRNPAVNWGRFARAGLLLAAGRAGFDTPSEGGSTLVTQMEKFRHSSEGRTDSPMEKLRQMYGASLKAYQDGRDTRDERRAIVAHYLDSMPLSAVPGFGEVHGLGAGLWAWFGLELRDVARDLRTDAPLDARARALKHVLALLCAVREPSRLLLFDRSALEQRVDAYAGLMAQHGIIEPELARAVVAHDLAFAYGPPADRLRVPGADKAVDGVRRVLLRELGVADFYELDRLDLRVRSTIDVALQARAARLLDRLDDPVFIEEHALREERLLAHGDPSQVLYSVLLYERTPRGNLLRVHADSLDAAFDLNEDMKLELGSTAKLRTLAHYLDIVAGLHRELSPLGPGERRRRVAAAGDPLTRWAGSVLAGARPTLPEMLEAALDRRYAASPREAFFTGGGVHRFSNFNDSDNARVLAVREATARSVNLVYIRLMRDLVRYHQARLPYDARAVLAKDHHPTRRRLLERAAEEEDRLLLFRAWDRFRNKEPRALLAALLGERARSARHLAILYFAWHPRESWGLASLARWFPAAGMPISLDRVEELFDAYDNPRLTLSDYAYLLDRHPMDVFAAGQLWREPGLAWQAVWSRSGQARAVSSAWLFKARNRRAQQRRLRVQIEGDAFAAMTPSWQRLGFPFDRLVPSLATSIGSSSDRPAALAELVGIILADGARLPTSRVLELRFADRTPYHTALARAPAAAERVMEPAVARALRATLALVVEEGTARRVRGAITNAYGEPVAVGGKTGSGDNRADVFARGGDMITSRAVNRTATFVFYVGDRYFGVITAFVDGPAAGAYRFTSSLPVTVLKLLGPELSRRVRDPDRLRERLDAPESLQGLSSVGGRERGSSPARAKANRPAVPSAVRRKPGSGGGSSPSVGRPGRIDRPRGEDRRLDPNVPPGIRLGRAPHRRLRERIASSRGATAPQRVVTGPAPAADALGHTPGKDAPLKEDRSSAKPCQGHFI
jgi:membrane peptidoglycan carboxypeptidase